MLHVDKPAIMRAAGMLRAFQAGDQQLFGDILTSSTDDGAYKTFCAMTAYATVYAQQVAHDQGLTVDQVITDAMTRLTPHAPE